MSPRRRRPRSARRSEPERPPESNSHAAPAPAVWRTIRENAEAIIVAIILALIIRHFSLEAFEIPTGSMAPGLRGVHITSVSPFTGEEHAIGIRVDGEGRVSVPWKRGWIYAGPAEGGSQLEAAVTGRGAPVGYPGFETRPGVAGGYRQSGAFSAIDVHCPQTSRVYREVFEPADCLGGHKILVNKLIYWLRPPRRWEVIVFRFNRQRNYIKRLIGLPGETVLVVAGDIWIDGSIERKPDAVQEHMWFPVYDSQVEELPDLDPPPWRMRGEGVWKAEGGATRFDARAADGELESAREFVNRYVYNSASTRDGVLEGIGIDPVLARSDWYVRDLRIAAELRPDEGQGTLELAVHNGPRAYGCRLPVGRPGSVELTFVGRDGKREILSSETADGLSSGSSHLVDFYSADRQLVLRVDGEVRSRFLLDGEGAVEKYGHRRSGPSKVSLRVQGFAGVFTRVRTWRDQHYTTQGPKYKNAVREPYQVSEHGYFAMGDNSPASLDSRAWGELSQDNLLGRAMAIFWPAWPWRFEVGFIH